MKSKVLGLKLALKTTITSAEETLQDYKLELNPIQQKVVQTEEKDQSLTDCIVNPCNLHLNNCSFKWTRTMLLKMSARITINVSYIFHRKSIIVFTNLSI